MEAEPPSKKQKPSGRKQARPDKDCFGVLAEPAVLPFNARYAILLLHFFMTHGNARDEYPLFSQQKEAVTG
jgi:hypothetical protein